MEKKVVTVSPIEIKSEMNTRSSHWARYKRFEEQKKAVQACWLEQMPRGWRPQKQTAITLVRHGSRKLDRDNLASSFKAVRDQIAKMIGIDDGDDTVQYIYDQVLATRKNSNRVTIIIDEGCDPRTHRCTCKENE